MSEHFFEYLSLREDRTVKVEIGKKSILFQIFDPKQVKIPFGNFIIVIFPLIFAFAVNFLMVSLSFNSIWIRAIFSILSGIFMILFLLVIFSHYESRKQKSYYKSTKPIYSQKYVITNIHESKTHLINLKQIGILIEKKNSSRPLINRMFHTEEIPLESLKLDKYSGDKDHIISRFLLVGLTTDNKIRPIIPPEFTKTATLMKFREKILDQNSTDRTDLWPYVRLINLIYSEFPNMQDALIELKNGFIVSKWISQPVPYLDFGDID